MTVPFDRPVPGFHDISVDADGDIEIGVDGGYHGETVDRTFDADELMAIAAFATSHKRAYKAFKDAGYADDSIYFKKMGEV